MKTQIHFFITALLFSCSIIVKAQDDFPQEPTFHFDLNTTHLTTEYMDHWESEYDYGYNNFHKQNNKVVLHSYSISSNGMYNKEFARDRAKAVKKFLQEKGVQGSRIKYIAYGETIMAGEEKSYFEDNDSYTYVIVTFEDLPVPTAIDPINQYKNKESLQWDIETGEGIFQQFLIPDIEKVKKDYQMVRKVFLQNPSSDPEVLKGQVKGILEDMKGIAESENPPKEALKFAAKIGLDAFVDLFTSNGSKEVNMARQAKYDIIIEAMAAACFPEYLVNVNGFEFDDKLLFYSVEQKLNTLSSKQKYQLRARFIAGKTFDFDTFNTAKKRFEKDMQNVSMFKKNLDHLFDQSKFSYRD